MQGRRLYFSYSHNTSQLKETSVRNLNQDTITQAVLARLATTPDARLKEIMTSLVQHLHAFAREVKLTEAEWMQGIEFLTATGQMCNAKRQEFILLSDTLGLSMLTVAMNNDKPLGCTEATVVGPFHVETHRSTSSATMWATAPLARLVLSKAPSKDWVANLWQVRTLRSGNRMKTACMTCKSRT